MPITNTLETTRKLEQAGFPPKQADALSSLFEDTARATQQDLKTFIIEQLAAMEGRLMDRIEARATETEAKLEVRIAQLESKLETRIAQLESRLEIRVAQVESNLTVHVAQTEARIAQVEGRLLREMRQQMVWITGLLIAIAAASIGAAKLLFG